MKYGILAVALLFATGSQAPQVDVKAELAKFQGSWAVASFNGEAVPAEAEAYLAFNGDKYEQWTTGTVTERGTVKLNPATKPASLDLVITEGDDAGKIQLGVYELSGDTATVGLAAPGTTTRPLAVSQGEVYVVLKKVK